MKKSSKTSRGREGGSFPASMAGGNCFDKRNKRRIKAIILNNLLISYDLRRLERPPPRYVLPGGPERGGQLRVSPFLLRGKGRVASAPSRGKSVIEGGSPPSPAYRSLEAAPAAGILPVALQVLRCPLSSLLVLHGERR